MGNWAFLVVSEYTQNHPKSHVLEIQLECIPNLQLHATHNFFHVIMLYLDETSLLSPHLR